MLVATVTALLLVFGGGSPRSGLPAVIAELGKAAEKAVKEEQRRQKIVALMAEMQATADAFRLRVVEARRAILEVDSNYRATRADYEKVFSELDAVWVQTEGKLIELRFRLRELMTRDEWDKAFGKADKARKKAKKKFKKSVER